MRILRLFIVILLLFDCCRFTLRFELLLVEYVLAKSGANTLQIGDNLSDLLNDFHLLTKIFLFKKVTQLQLQLIKLYTLHTNLIARPTDQILNAGIGARNCYSSANSQTQLMLTGDWKQGFWLENSKGDWFRSSESSQT